MTLRNDASRTRIPIKEARRLRAVVARQGQVLLDTDFDRQVHHQLERLETETADTLGSPGRLLVPAGNDGFLVTAGATPIDFNIGAGWGYLGGWLLENATSCMLATQPHPRTGDTLTTPAVIAIKSLIRHIDPVEAPELADVALGDAQASGRSLVDWQVFPFDVPGNAGLSCATVLSDPNWIDLTAPSTGKLTLLEQAAAPSTDPCSLTPGVGTTRYENLLLRFEIHSGDPDPTYPDIDGPRFKLDNLKIKFSRRNASLMVRIAKITNAEITVSPPALDPRNWFSPGQYAEIVSIHDDLDPRAALASERMFRVATATDDQVVLEATAAEITATGATADGTWFLRLWDAFPGGAGLATASAPNPATESAEIDAGDNLKIKLGAGTFRRGDHWCCAIRADGTADWPKTGGIADAMTPHGPEVRYSPLAVMPGAAPPIEDCRIPFATLSDRVLLYRGGDGQGVFTSANSGSITLPSSVRVAVMRGKAPVVGATVRWSFVGPAGSSCQIGGTLCDGATTVDTVTDANGLIDATWSIDASKPLEVHRVQAALLEGNATVGPAIVFSAMFETAKGTSYTPGQCTSLLGVNDVQSAIDTLCSKIGSETTEPKAMGLKSIFLFSPSAVPPFDLIEDGLILNALEVAHDRFARGIEFVFDGPLGTQIQLFDPIVEIELDLPYPTTDADRLYWSHASGINSFFGFQRMRLDGMVGVKGNTLVWRPTEPTQAFLAAAPAHRWGQKVNADGIGNQVANLPWASKEIPRVLCRLRLRSALIWGDEKESGYLNAEYLGVKPSALVRPLALKQRDPQRAADLDIFIYLTFQAMKGKSKSSDALRRRRGGG